MKRKVVITWIIFGIMAIAILAISMAIVYAISTSALPEWLKFWLLRL